MINKLLGTRLTIWTVPLRDGMQFEHSDLCLFFGMQFGYTDFNVFIYVIRTSAAKYIILLIFYFDIFILKNISLSISNPIIFFDLLPYSTGKLRTRYGRNIKVFRYQK